MMKWLAFCLSLPFFSESTDQKTKWTAIEICDNTIDDDQDGLIDLNDPDCICNGISDSANITSSYIPNASFEEYTTCPYFVSQMEFCKGWIQASDATSDYYNTCGYRGHPSVGLPPMPLPSGYGYVGFLDIRQLSNNIYIPVKEYVGTCLINPLVIGKEYTLSFWIGFGTGGSVYSARDTFNLGIFATDSCKYLPFIDPFKKFDCPSIISGWYTVNSVNVSGKNEWINVKIKIKPTRNIEALIIGPACEMTDGKYYYWMDELILQESINFEPLSIQTKTNLCSEDTVVITASKSFLANSKYQWYKDGIAIVGAIGVSYSIPKEISGTYVVRLSYGSECEISTPFYYVNRDLNPTKIDTSLCLGSPIRLGNKLYSDAGIYFDTLKNLNGCDSILEIKVEAYPKYLQTIMVERCQSTTFEFDGRSLDSTGLYTFNYSSLNGCDSTILVDLLVHKEDFNEFKFEICDGDYVQVANKIYDQAGLYYDTLSNVFGCDSVLEVNIIQRNTHLLNLDSTICDGSFVGVGTNTYSRTGNYTDSLKSIYYCDSVIQLNLLVNKVDKTILDSNICEGEFVEVFGIKYDTTGNYSLKGENQYACDSIVNLNLKKHINNSTKIDTAICEGSFINVLDQRYSSTTDVVLHTMNQNNCDSSILLSLLVNPVYDYSIKEVICEGSWVSIGNQKFDKTGLYTIALKSSLNCDSIIQLELKANSNSSFKLDTIICYQQELNYGNQTFSQTGNYQFLNKNQFDCDSTTDINLLVNSEIYSIDSIRQLNCENDQNGEIIPNILGGQGPYSYRWNTGSHADALKELSFGKYILSITDQHNCTFIKDFHSDQVPCFCFDIKSINGSCLDGGLGIIQIKQKSGRNPIDYYLNGKPYSVLGNEIQNLSPGSYLLEMVDEKNCNFSQTFNLDLEDQFVQNLGVDTLQYKVGDSIDLSFNLPSHLTYQKGEWSGESIACPNCFKTKSFATLGESEFTFSGEDVNGCPFVYKLVVVAKQGFFAPSAFSPNDDASNDFFNLISDSSVEIIDLLQIYNRWGERIFESRSGIPNTSVGAWDGSFQGEKLNPGVYVYLIQFRDKTGTPYKLTGDVSLVR
ncbi:MAG: gliding motility-associated C-terminal domain-containing protein [Saprospiraceae bacterium]|nr:gliding motility-associated C-terminal domain-containing protein [Saprospiraceae bacterium]